MRWLGALALFAVVLSFPGTARAHELLLLTVHTDGRGSVWVSATWQDGHPVTEPVVATLTATRADGRRIGPAPLTGSLRYPGTLAPGVWTVVAETARPGLGRCEAVLTVAPAGTAPAGTAAPAAPLVGSAAPAAPQRVSCGEPQTPAAAALPAATEASAGDGGGAGLKPVALLATAVAGLTLLAAVGSRRRHRSGSS